MQNTPGSGMALRRIAMTRATLSASQADPALLLTTKLVQEPVTRPFRHTSLPLVKKYGNRVPENRFSALQAQQGNVAYKEGSPLGAFCTTERASA